MLFKHLSLLSLATLAVGQIVPDLPTFFLTTPEVSELVGLVTGYPEVYGILGSAKNITLLAPSNDAVKAFQALPQTKKLTKVEMAAVLSNHVLVGAYPSAVFNAAPMFPDTFMGAVPRFRNISGDSQVVKLLKEGKDSNVYGGMNQKAKITRADIKVKGGIVHIIDKFIQPPVNISATVSALGLTNVTQFLGRSGRAGAVDSLAGVTVFAPNNNAFKPVADVLSKLTRSQTAEIFNSHVVPGFVGYSPFLRNGAQFKAANGKVLTVRTDRTGQIFVDDARIVTTNVLTNNGVLHVVDRAINPNDTLELTDPNVISGGPGTDGSTQSIGGVARVSVSDLLVIGVAGLFAFGMVA